MGGGASKKAARPAAAAAKEPEPAAPHVVEDEASVRWRELDGDRLDRLLEGKGEVDSAEERRTRPVRLVRASYIIGLYQRGEKIPTRKEIAEEEGAFLSLDELKQAALTTARAGQAGRDILPILAVSYPWLHKDNPDPKGYHLSQLGPALERLLAGRDGWDVSFGVFVDWMCLYQNAPSSRDQAEDELFGTALGDMDVWYGHKNTTVLSLTALPERYPEGYYDAGAAGISNVATYHSRGWCRFEWVVAGMIKDKDRRLDLGFFDPVVHSHRQKMINACRQSREPPIAPNAFDRIVRGDKPLAFTKGNQDAEHVIKLHSQAFGRFFRQADKLRFSSCGWGDAEAEQLSQTLNCGYILQRLVELQLDDNEIGDSGARAISAALRDGGDEHGAAPELETVYLHSNRISDAGARSIVEALRDAKQWSPKLERLKLDGNPASDAAKAEVLAALASRKLPA